MHRMHRIFSGDGWLVFPDILKSARDHRPSQRSPAAASRPDYPVHPVHRCSIYSPSRWICPVAGGGRPARRQTGVSQRGQAGFQRSRPPDTPHLTIGTTPPGSAGVPPACCPLGCRSVSLRCCSRPPCRREPHGPGRSRALAPLPVEPGGGDGRRLCQDLCGRDARAPGWASSHDRVTPTGQKCRSILAPVVVEGGPSVLVPETKPVSLSYDPPRRGGRGPYLPETIEGYPQRPKKRNPRRGTKDTK